MLSSHGAKPVPKTIAAKSEGTTQEGKMKISKKTSKCSFDSKLQCYTDAAGNEFKYICPESKDKSLGSDPKCFDGSWYEKRINTFYSNGYIEEYYTGEYCDAFIISPGTSLLNKDLLGFAYFMFMCYLFLGISIIADIFMEAIEVITSTTKEIKVFDKEGNGYIYLEKIWNPTIANLTLMALGSSAPEILLSVIEALKSLGEPAGELGPSSIVGSGAFNLLCISGISIIAVDEPKRINDMGVYSCTAFFSIFAYAWMYYCLELNTKNYVTPGEAWLTLAFFFILVCLAFALDKYKQSKDKQKIKEQDADKELLELRKKSDKAKLLKFSKDYTKASVINVVKGIKAENIPK